MKTRQEILYDFMVALSSNPSIASSDISPAYSAEAVWELANALTNRYFEGLS